jgi:hypothetical protein
MEMVIMALIIIVAFSLLHLLLTNVGAGVETPSQGASCPLEAE